MGQVYHPNASAVAEGFRCYGSPGRAWLRANDLPPPGRAVTVPVGGRYLGILGAAALCYAALGAVLRALPWFVGARLHGGPVAIGLAVGAPSITGALLRPVGGRLADRSGPMPVMLGGAGLMAVGVLPAFLPNLVALVVSRLLVGCGEALMMSSAVTWLLVLAGPVRRGRALGHIGLANYAGLTVGPVLADAIALRAHTDILWATAILLPLLGGLLAATQGGVRKERGDGFVPKSEARGPEGSPLRQTLRPGLGLLLVNVGYVAVLSFGATAAAAHHIHMGAIVVPIFGVGVIASRTLLADIPDRMGAGRTLVGGALAAGAGLAILAVTSNEPMAVLGVLVIALGQGMSVPALGLLALSRIHPSRYGAAAGLFFAYFDAGVGLGGPLVGLVARVVGAPFALLAAGVAVAVAAPVALLFMGSSGSSVGSSS